jgi:hypothetical protein
LFNDSAEEKRGSKNLKEDFDAPSIRDKEKTLNHNEAP